MKKSTFQKLFLMLLPIGAVGLATTPDSVRVLNTLTGEAAGYSYFSLVEGIPFQMAAPMAAILSLVSGILAAVYLGAKKTGCLKGISVTAFLASCFGVLPILFPGETLVVPNVLLPIMMVAEAVLAWYMKKKPVEEGEKAPGWNPICKKCCHSEPPMAVQNDSKTKKGGEHMAFPPAFIDELVARNPIEDVVGHYVNLKRSGSNLFGLCPFHGEKTASFSVAPEKGIYYCFGCHKGGSVINFQMEIEGLSYPDAVRALAKRAGMEVPEDEQYQSRYRQQERLWALHKEAARFYHGQLYGPAGAAALQYATGRGMPKSILTKFGIGYAPDSWTALVDVLRKKGYTDQELRDSGLVTVSRKNGNLFDRFRDRLMFPIIDVRGNVIGFGGRIMKKDDNAAKYLNSPETLIFNKRKNLFALNIAKKSKLGYLILVEGYMDAIALHQYGFDCAVASLGTALTEDGASLLSKYTEQVVLIYDGDNAGQNATKRAIPILEKAGLQVKVLQMRDAKDPDEFLKKFGADRFKLLLEESSNRVEYQLNAILKKYDLRDDDQRVKYLQESAELISGLPSAVQREVYGSRVAEAAKIGPDAMKLEVDRARKRRLAKEKKAQEKQDLSPVRNLQPKSRSIRYDNMKSAMAEEMLLALCLRESALLDQCGELTAEMFSSPLLGKVFSQLLTRHKTGMEVSLSGLTDLSSEEMSHVAGILQRQEGPISEQALSDCVRTIQREYRCGKAETVEDLMALRNAMMKRKGINP